QNTIQSNAWYVTLGGGWSNKIQAYATYATLGGGYQNTIEAYAEYVTLGGGQENTIQTYAHYATLGGGWLNAIQTNASSATIGGGGENTIQTNAPFATIPGGRNNTVGAGATNAFAAGRRAKANHRGAFVWADSTDADFASTTANQFCVRAAGGVKIDTGNGPSIMLNGADRAMITRSFDTFNSGVHYPAGRWGVFMEPSKLVMGMPAIGGKEVHIAKYNADSTYTSLVWVTQSGDLYTLGAVNPPSDRAMKTDFAGVDGREIAAKVAALQIHSWRYAHDEGAARHLGPTAQDFRAAFGLGGSDRHIATVDADGVALAAIQGLYTLVREKEDEITELKGRLAELEARINRLVTH
ncbi:MAG: tail fiber domain-containing protein, partial [Verrucomicrobia bacterium]|nr:tail fiber domain-containing protein [Verrucomicrobiota bacterium]